MHNFIKAKASGNENIYIESLRILPEKQRWINDQIVNYYLELVQKFVSDNHTGTLKSVVYAAFLRHIKNKRKRIRKTVRTKAFQMECNGEGYSSHSGVSV
jgi:Zn-dependent M16 (insulinase) family peptidase